MTDETTAPADSAALEQDTPESSIAAPAAPAARGAAETEAEVLESAARDTSTELPRKLAAEAIGTFLLVTFGVGTAVSTHGDVAPTGLAFGFAVILGAYAFGRISGAHFNPAVSIGSAISGRLPWVEAGWYILAQLVGAIVGALFLFIVVHGIHGYSISQNGLGQDSFGGDHLNAWSAFVTELVLTAAFIFVILAVTDERFEFAASTPVAIGLTLAVIHFVAIPLTGTSVNPARSIGPALFAGGHALGQVWLFILAPAVGGALGGLAYPAVFGRTHPPVPGSGFKLTLPERSALPSLPSLPSFGGSASADASGDTATHAAVPTWQQPVAHDGDLPVYEQDGWRWDYATQQWVPVDQSAAAAPAEDVASTEETTRIVPPTEP